MSSIPTYAGLISLPWADYELIDTGNAQRLERVGSFLVVRPESTALWQPQDPSHKGWQNPDARFIGTSKERLWDRAAGVPTKWPITWNNLTFEVGLTPFRHIGLFPEQQPQWRWIQEKLASRAKSDKPLRVLNLFAYTGLASLAAAQMGAQVCHVDSAKGSVYWASDNARASALSETSIRWIVEDVRSFIARELRRGSTYDLILMDPPVFGRGTKGEIWRLEDDLISLLRTTRQLFRPKPLGFLMNIYATTLYPYAIQRLVQDMYGDIFPTPSLSAVYIAQSAGKTYLQTGFCLHS